MAEPACAAVRELAPELALGLVTGSERAAALEHLQECAECRAHVESLTRLHDRLRGLIPTAEPPVGFEQRVLARIDTARIDTARTPSTRRPVARWALAAVGAAALFGAGWGVNVAATPVPAGPGAQSVVDVALRSPAAPQPADLGRVHVAHGVHPWLYLYLDVRPGIRHVTCSAVGRDGSVADLATVPVRGDDAYWGGPIPPDRADIATVRVLDDAGAVVAEAQLPR